MKQKLILMALVLLMIPLVVATEITGELSTDPDFYQEEVPVEPQPPQDNPSSSSSSGGGGGGGSPTTTQATPPKEEVPAPVKEEAVLTQKENEVELVPKGKTEKFSLEKGEIISFTINGKSYSLEINQIDEDSVQFTLNSELITDTLKISQIKSYDLDKNGVDEISIFLVEIINGKVQLELVDLVPNDNSLENSLTGAAVGVSNQSSWIYGVGILAMVVILTGGIVYFKSKKEKKKK